jgi:hypothetical protein
VAIYSLAQRPSLNIDGLALWELVTGTERVAVIEIGYSNVSQASTRQIGLGRPITKGLTPTLVAFQAEDFASPACTASGVIAWGNGMGPPLPSTLLRRANISGTGSQLGTVVWRFPEGLIVPASSSLALFNIAGSSACDMWAVIDE